MTVDLTLKQWSWGLLIISVLWLAASILAFDPPGAAIGQAGAGIGSGIAVPGLNEKYQWVRTH